MVIDRGQQSGWSRKHIYRIMVHVYIIPEQYNHAISAAIETSTNVRYIHTCNNRLKSV